MIDTAIHRKWLDIGQKLATSIDGLDVDVPLALQIAKALQDAYREGLAKGNDQGYNHAQADAYTAAVGGTP